MILITGGTGFVGRRLARALDRENVPLAVLTRSGAGQNGLPAGTRIAIGDVTDPVAVRAALDGVQGVIHLAANLAPKSASEQPFRTNVEGTRILAAAARSAGVASFVHVSSAAVYGHGPSTEPLEEDAPLEAASPYGRSKREAEQALVAELSGGATRWVILRPPGIYGPGRPQTLAFVREVRRKWLWVHGPMRKMVQPTHVDDVVSACIAAWRRNDVANEVFNVAGEAAVPYQELIALVARLLGRSVWQVSLPAFRGMHNRAVSNRKAERWLGLRPRPLEAGMAETIASFRAEDLLP